jgi:hypothetical protein
MNFQKGRTLPTFESAESTQLQSPNKDCTFTKGVVIPKTKIRNTGVPTVGVGKPTVIIKRGADIGVG